MLIYSVAFKYYDRIMLSKHRAAYVFIASTLIAVAVIAGIRFLSGEDGWICTDGQWVEHGHPSAPAPTAACPR